MTIISYNFLSNSEPQFNTKTFIIIVIVNLL